MKPPDWERDSVIPIHLTVNGQPVERLVPPHLLLSDFLRHELELTGTHVGCEHGVCGACTVLVDGLAVRSCLMIAAQANGCTVTTVEGLARDGKLHPVQEAFIKHHALQCGFCTPGMIMTACDLIRRRPDLTPEAVREEMSGNLCRCTGYAAIVSAVLAAAGDSREDQS